MHEQQALVILNAISGIGNATIKKLIEYYGSAIRCLELSRRELSETGILSAKVIHNFMEFPKEKFLSNELRLLKEEGIAVMTFLDEGYPKNLLEIPDAPVVLYIKGTLPQTLDLSIAIVGSRKATLYGSTVAEQFASRLSDAGVTIVSGMARGIDTAAHQGALKSRGKTVAVLGSGLKHIYPIENKDLYERIALAGAVISEFSMETPPVAVNFPRRNRIISGLSLGVIVVEAAQKSGALITADCALEQGREVYAVPGKVDSPFSFGVHDLIKQGAKLVTSVDDVIEDLSDLMAGIAAPATADLQKMQQAYTQNRLEGLTEQENSVLAHISRTPVHIDDISHVGTAGMSETMAVLLRLEMKKLIKQLPGKFFAKETY